MDEEPQVNQRIVSRKTSRRWQVTKPGDKLSTTTHTTRALAVDAGRLSLRRDGGGELVIFGAGGCKLGQETIPAIDGAPPRPV